MGAGWNIWDKSNPGTVAKGGKKKKTHTEAKKRPGTHK